MKGIPKGLQPFGQVKGWQPLRGSGRRPEYVRRFAKGEFKNSPVDCFWRGNALQEKASPTNHDLYLLYNKW